MTGSHAMEAHEPRQVWKEAAISGPFHVPWINLVWANCRSNV